MCCIESVSFSININGHLSETWKPERGIKQGDRVSPYIFILCINFLILKFIEGHLSSKFDGLKIISIPLQYPFYDLRMIALYYAKLIINQSSSFRTP